MSANAEIEYQREVTEIVGGLQTRNVVEIGAVSKPSGVFFQYRVNRDDWSADAAKGFADQYAEWFESALQDPNVASITYLQDTNAQGNLVDLIDIGVVSDSGKSSVTTRQPFIAAQPGILDPTIAPIVAELNASEE